MTTSVPSGPLIWTVFRGCCSAAFLLRGGGSIAKETSGGIDSGALPILDEHLGEEMKVLRGWDTAIRLVDGWVIGSIGVCKALFKQRQRALGNIAMSIGLHFDVTCSAVWSSQLHCITCEGSFSALFLGFPGPQIPPLPFNIASTTSTLPVSLLKSHCSTANLAVRGLF